MNRHRESIRLLYIVRNSLEFPRGILILSIPNSNVEELYILYKHYARVYINDFNHIHEILNKFRKTTSFPPDKAGKERLNKGNIATSKFSLDHPLPQPSDSLLDKSFLNFDGQKHQLSNSHKFYVDKTIRNRTRH